MGKDINASFLEDMAKSEDIKEIKEIEEELVSGNIESDTGNALDVYLHEIQSLGCNLLSSEEECALGKRIQQGDEEARKTLIEKNLRLVISVAKRYMGKGLQFEDLIQEGNLGLMKAVDYFNPDLGYRFSTYAIWWVRNSIQRALFNSGAIRIPVHMNEYMIKVKAYIARYELENGCEPSESELNQFIEDRGINKKLYDMCVRMSQVVSLDTPVANSDMDNDSVVGDFIAAEGSDFATNVVNNLSRDSLYKALDLVCTQKEKNVVLARYGFLDGTPKTLEEVGDMYGVTRERIRQIEKKAFGKLRRSYKSRELIGSLREG